MTELLEQAFAVLKTLPDSEQNAIAAMILEELEEETRWDEAFAKSQDVLGELPTLPLRGKCWLPTQSTAFVANYAGLTSRR